MSETPQPVTCFVCPPPGTCKCNCGCNIEVLQGHKVGCFTEQGDSSCDYLAAGTKTVGVYLYETACGTFTAVGVTGALLLMEADKVRILAI